MNKSLLQPLHNTNLKIFFASLFFLLGILYASGRQWTAPTQAEELAGPRDARALFVDSQGTSPFVEVAQRMLPTVVHIKVREQSVPQGQSLFEDRWHEFFGLPGSPNSQPRRREVSSSGSGFIFDEQGHVLTNNHVVADADEITVVLSDGAEFEAEIVGTDPETDLAVIRVDHGFDRDHVAVLGDSDAIRVGDWAIALGNPLGLDQTLTVGVISAKGRANLNISGGAPIFQNFIQTDAAINFGNSGGPLVNIRGEVIGINTAINAMGQGIGFAIPSNMAVQIVRDLIERGQVTRGYLGMVPVELTSELRAALELDEDQFGIFVDSVEDGTPAAEGGLEPGDVITKWNDEDVQKVNDFRIKVARVRPGEKATAEVIRGGKTRSLKFTLVDRAQHMAGITGTTPQLPRDEIEAPYLGLEVAELDARTFARYELDEELVRRHGGVVITGLRRDSPARGDLSPGDVITKIDRYTIEDLDDYRDAARRLRELERATLVHIIRGSRSTIVPVVP